MVSMANTQLEKHKTDDVNLVEFYVNIYYSNEQRHNSNNDSNAIVSKS